MFTPKISRHYVDSPKVDFNRNREMTPYLEEPKAMYVGAPGKHGYLNLGFELNGEGKSILRELDRRAPLIVQQELYFDEQLPNLPCVYILSSGGPNVDGDRYQQNITVRKDAMAYVSTGAATKLASMKYNYSGMIQNIVLEENAYLEFMPEPTIPHAGTRFACDTKMVIDPTATALYSEIYMAGRKYHGNELYKYDILSVTTHGERPDGVQLFREKFIIRPGMFNVRDTGVMGKFDIFANVVVMTPPDKAKEIYDNTDVYFKPAEGIAAGITHLPNNAGLLFKALGMEPGLVKKVVRNFCSTVRQAVKGVPLPEEFPWR